MSEEMKEEVKAAETVQETAKAEKPVSGFTNADLEALNELLRLQKNEAKHARVTSILMAVLVGIFLVCAVIIVPKAVSILNDVNKITTQVQGSLNKVDSELDNISTMVESITKTSEGVNTMVEENTEALTQTVQELTEIDFQGLNQAIQDLQDAIGPFANTMRTMSMFR